MAHSPPEDRTPPARRRVSVRWLGWALTCATLGAALVGVVIVERLGGDGAPAPPPIEIDSPPPTADNSKPAFHVLRPDEPNAGAAWPDASFPQPGVQTATRPDQPPAR